MRLRLPAGTRRVATLVAAGLVLTGCSGDPTAMADPLAGADVVLAELTAAEVQRQAEEEIEPNPLGLLLDGCPVLDDAGIAAVGRALGIAEGGTVVNAVLQDPEGTRTVRCAISYGEGSDGAVVLSLGPTGGDVDAVRQRLAAADFTEQDQPVDVGLPEGSVLVLDSDQFDASRAVYVGQVLELGVTANTDLAGTGALVAALPTVVEEVGRVLDS